MHSTDDRIAIASSKSKVGLLTMGAFLFVVAGIWLFEVADTQNGSVPSLVEIA
jgi:hypothetical protein